MARLYFTPKKEPRVIQPGLTDETELTSREIVEVIKEIQVEVPVEIIKHSPYLKYSLFINGLLVILLLLSLIN